MRIQAIQDERELEEFSEKMVEELVSDLERTETNNRINKIISKLRTAKYLVTGSIEKGWLITEPTGRELSANSADELEKYCDGVFDISYESDMTDY